MTSAIDYAHVALKNWGAWSRADLEHGSLVSSIWAFWFPHKSGVRDSGWGDPGAPEAMPSPVDEQAAWQCELVVRRLPSGHRHTLKRHYVLQRSQPEIELGASLRAFVDATDSGEIAWPA